MCLRYLSLCPDGLGHSDLIQISPEWNEKWVHILKEKSMIIEKKIYEEEYTMKRNLTRCRSKRKSKNIRSSMVDDDVFETVYKMDPKFRKYVAEELGQNLINKYDEKIVGLMNSKMQELLHASNQKIGLLEIYEENLWEILERLRKLVIKKKGNKFLNDTIMKDSKQMNGKQFFRQISRLNTFAGEKKQKRKDGLSITKLFAMKKFKIMKEPSLEELCFTGKYEDADPNPSSIDSDIANSSPSQRSIGGSLFCSGLINSPRSRMQQSQQINKMMVNKIIGLNMEKIEEEKDNSGKSSLKPKNPSGSMGLDDQKAKS